jgi:hypothetical protein
MSADPPVARFALVGDVVGSREFPDQARLLTFLQAALERVNAFVAAAQPLRPTVGDEFQGAYASLPLALRAALVLRLELSSDPSLDPAPDVRFGLGTGDITVVPGSSSPFAQSGSAWWNARQAFDHVEGHHKSAIWPRSLRTWLRSERRADDVVNSFLICRDELLAGMDARDHRLTLGLFRGETQNDMAKELGISQPAVARRQKEHGVQAIYRAQLSIEEALA